MKKREEFQEELVNCTNRALGAAQELAKMLDEFDSIDLGEVSEEEYNEYRSCLIEIDRHKSLVLRRLLLEYGNLLFV
jgi:hypothetical protein